MELRHSRWLPNIKTGDQVTITAKDEFYAFVDGWNGEVVGWQAGCAEIVCNRPDGDKKFFVPTDQLVLNIRGKS